MSARRTRSARSTRSSWASCGPTGSGSGSRSGRGATRAVTGTTTSVATSSFTRTRAASIGRMRRGLAFSLAALAVALCSASCGSAKHELAPSPRVANFALRSKLMGRTLYEELVTPAGGGKGRPLLVFLQGYGATPSDTVSAAFTTALRRLGDRAPVVFLPEGDVGWWHNDSDGPWGSYVLREAIPAALRRSGAAPHRVAIGGISMGGFGSLDLARLAPGRFCAVGGQSAAMWFRGADTAAGVFDDAEDVAGQD